MSVTRRGFSKLWLGLLGAAAIGKIASAEPEKSKFVVLGHVNCTFYRRPDGSVTFTTIHEPLSARAEKILTPDEMKRVHDGVLDIQKYAWLNQADN